MANITTIWSQFFLTDAGLRLRQQSIATGAELVFSFAKIGQGVPINPANIPLMTDIVSAAEEVPVVRSEAEGVTHYVGVRVDNKDFKQPVLMTEIGLFAKIGDDEPVLYGYTYATQGYDSIPAGKISHYVWTIGIDTVISRAQSISFSYDGSKVYATEEEIDRLIQAFDAFKEEIRGGLMPSDMPEQVSAAVEKADQAEQTANDVKKQLDNFSASSVTEQNIIIPTTGWVECPPEEYDGISVDVPIEGVTASMIPLVSVIPSDEMKAKPCRFGGTPSTADGYLRIYAQNQPTEPISASVALLSTGATTASGEFLPATAARLGGVKIGDGINVTGDGTISVNSENLVDEIAASEDEGSKIVNKYFGKSGN